MKFNPKELKKKAEESFEEAWQEGSKLITQEGGFRVTQKRKEHPLWKLIERARKTFLEMGFSETLVPMLVHKFEVYKQYGPQAPVILDRVFFLSVLERPDIGISEEKKRKLREISPQLDVEKLQNIFRRYKLGEVSPDDLTETLVRELRLSEHEAGRVLSLFDEFRRLQPKTTDMTLRSHTTAGWFTVLREMMKREPLPLQLFSIGPKFRREQRLDSTHLYESWTASLVIMAEDIGLKEGMDITRDFLRRMGYPQIHFEFKRATSRYYAPGTEFEVFVRHPKTQEPIEVGDGGMYSPIALAQYDIPYPVFNVGIGLERLAMIETGEDDIRALCYPYLYRQPSFDDKELAKMIHPELQPLTPEGKVIAQEIEKVARERKDEPSPCCFQVWKGEMAGRKTTVEIFESESGRKLVGPAGFNEIYVCEGNIIGLPPWEEFGEVRKRGVPTGLTYMRAFALLAARKIEEACLAGEPSVEIKVKNVKLPSDINLSFDEPLQFYVTSNRKRIDIRGPFFTSVRATFEP